MEWNLARRGFLKVGAGACAACLARSPLFAEAPPTPVLLSPGCRKSKVRVAKVYLGIPRAHWPTPLLNLEEEVKTYESEFERMRDSFADMEFPVNELVSAKEQAAAAKDKLGGLDGVLLIHLSMGVTPLIKELLAAGLPTALFAAPYSGHEWTGFGALQKEAEGRLEVLLTSDSRELAAAVRPFRAIHHLREAKLLNVTEKPLDPSFLQTVKDKFGTEIVAINKARMTAVYDSISEADAVEEAGRWIDGAVAVVEPPKEEIQRSCRLALAFEKLMDEEQATGLTVDCYGSMYRNLPAFPCIGFTRLNDMGLAGVCESDMRSALTFMMMQTLSGRPGFVSDPTMDGDEIILAHCMGTRRMLGPDGPASTYKLRTIMERQEGAVAQIKMPIGKKVTQAILPNMEELLYFTGDAVDAPDLDRGCRTKITVKVDGDSRALWRNWSHGLHRVTCYGDLSEDLRRFCGYKKIRMTNEAALV
ncbi:MAG: hypothetical protein HUU16_17745 [Candidatus Omnitrophica bacterium]|nr:hypothetical protein [bacterium]NUN98010.1 hypothetical protein [Candidatus Omnitrophota bacterium]